MGQKTSMPVGEDRRKCYNFQGYGHSRKDCPSNRVLSLMEVKAMEENGWVEFEDETPEEECDTEEEPEG